MTISLIADIVGMLGTALVVAAYVLLQIEKLDAKSYAYSVLNLFGAFFLMLSLLVHFNLASMVIEIFWIAASLIGIWQVRRRQLSGRS